jgi:hypothetical protein
LQAHVVFSRWQAVSNNWVVSVVVSNDGRGTLGYGYSPFLPVRCKIGGAWTNLVPNRGPTAISFLLPGDAIRETFRVPFDADACKIGCYFEDAGAKGAVMARLIKARWGRYLWRLGGWAIRSLPNGADTSLETWSPELVFAHDGP